MITLNKEILMHPDFKENFEENIIEFLNSLIDAELKKGDETDFDFIDECADAINAVREGDTAAVMPVISRKDFMKKVRGTSGGRLGIFVAACAVLAILVSVNASYPIKETTVIKEISGYISELFNRNPTEINLTEPSVTYHETTEAIPTVTDITVETAESFKTEYYVGESFSPEGIRVFAEYDNGERRLLKSREVAVTVSESFGKSAGYETVRVSMGGFSKTLEVRVIEKLSTPKLSSVYALFPEGFTFTARDLDNIDLSEMKVYAVYSDKTERELSPDEYEITAITENRLFEKSSFVTVSYGECTCSFRIFKE